MQELRSFEDIERWLVSIRPDIKAVNWFFALDDMKKLMAGLGNPQEQMPVVHVAGTSGKTSTCYYMAEMLRRSGKQTGLTVSPHVDAINERVQLNGHPLQESEYVKLFTQFITLPQVKAMDITYFGLLVAFAYWVFAQKQVDYSVVEVGMGGTTDATNIIESPNKVCIITDIGLDHTKFLGDTLTAIAGEKAGIIKPGNHVFVARQAEEIMEVFERRAKAQKAVLHIMPNEKITEASSELPPFQRRNWSLAKFAYDFIATRDGLSVLGSELLLESTRVPIPARMEQVKYRDKTIILDGSHNGQKIGALCAGVAQKYANQEIVTMIAMVEGKDATLKQSLQELHAISDHLIVTSFNASQDVYRPALDPTIIASEARKQGFAAAEILPKPEEAFSQLLRSQAPILLVTGSFFLLNHVRPQLTRIMNT